MKRELTNTQCLRCGLFGIEIFFCPNCDGDPHLKIADLTRQLTASQESARQWQSVSEQYHTTIERLKGELAEANKFLSIQEEKDRIANANIVMYGHENELLKRELAECRQQLEIANDLLRREREEKYTLELQLSAMRKGLAKLEWTPTGVYVLTNCCPACGGHKEKSGNAEYDKYSPAGHKPDCWLAALLAPKDEKGEA